MLQYPRLFQLKICSVNVLVDDFAVKDKSMEVLTHTTIESIKKIYYEYKIKKKMYLHKQLNKTKTYFNF